MLCNSCGSICVIIRRVVTAGGVESGANVELFNVDTERWSLGLQLATPMHGFAAIQYEDSFLLVGGYDQASVDLNTKALSQSMCRRETKLDRTVCPRKYSNSWFLTLPAGGRRLH